MLSSLTYLEEEKYPTPVSSSCRVHLGSTSEVHCLGSQAHQNTDLIMGSSVYMMILPASFGTRDREDRGVMTKPPFLYMPLSHL